MKPIGIMTNGIGEATRQHLNLTRSLAEVPEFRPIPDRVFVTRLMPKKEKPAPPARQRKPKPPPKLIYRLRFGPQYLAQCTTRTTPDPAQAWSGTAESALQVCNSVPLAAPMYMELQ